MIFQARKGEGISRECFNIAYKPNGFTVTLQDWPWVCAQAEIFAHAKPAASSVEIWCQGKYIVTGCGGSSYWEDHDHLYPETECSMHQIGSLGHCWECFHAGYGFVRHPVTPEEVLRGELNPIKTRFEKPCPACGGGYSRPAVKPAGWTPDAVSSDLDGGPYVVEYVQHGPYCARLNNGEEHSSMPPGLHCAGCGARCCTGNQEDGPCRCTEEDRLADLRSPLSER
jgi:hypothetical protein